MANLNIRVDDTLIKQAETVFSDLGISLSTATTMFLKQWYGAMEYRLN